MDKLKLDQIAFAQGWLASHFHAAIETTQEGTPERSTAEETLKAFVILSDGYDKVRRDNLNHERRMMLIRGALNS